MRHFKVQVDKGHNGFTGLVAKTDPNKENKVLALYGGLDSNGKPTNPIALLREKRVTPTEPLESNMPTIIVDDLDRYPNGTVMNISDRNFGSILFNPLSNDNSLFCTNNCDNECIMCSQPPKAEDDYAYFHSRNMKVVNLINSECEVLGITGGEPLFNPLLFKELLSYVSFRLPNTNLNILSNGRAFSDQQVAKTVGDISTKRCLWEIPIHSDSPALHDLIAGKEGSFLDTLSGLYNFSKTRPRILIRHIIQKSNINRLYKFSQFITKYVPFIEAVSFMGLEYVGYAKRNFPDVHTDILSDQQELSRAIELLLIAGVSVSIFNIPLCMLKKALWEYSYKSIDKHKRYYLPICDQCSVKDNCGGIFKSNANIYSEQIQPF